MGGDCPRSAARRLPRGADRAAEKGGCMKPRFFKTPADFRAWLEKHHADTPELLVGFYKKASGKGGITYHEGVDCGLCYGWIDGVKKRVDDVSYMHRFTPRRAGSIWSNVNTKRAA